MGAVCYGVCCCATCGCCGTACGKVNADTKKYASFAYCGLLFIGILLAVVLRNNQTSFGFTLYGDAQVDDCGSDCRSDQAVYRICLALTIFFASHVVVTVLSPPAIARDFHQSFFGWKFLLFIPLLVGMFFIDRESMEQFADAARVFSVFFLIVIAIAVIDSSYRLNEWMIKVEAGYMDVILLVSSISLYVGSIIAIGFMFTWFTEGGDCHVQKFILSTVIIAPFFYTLLSISERVKHGSIFVSGMITSYVVWLAYSALSSDPSETCNSFINQTRDADTWQIILGVLFLAISIVYVAWTMGNSASFLFGPQETDEDGEAGKNIKDLEGDTKNENGDAGGSESDEDLVYRKQVIVTYHVLMTLASMYICMLLTRWSSQDYSDREARYLSDESFWVQTTSLWIIMILYTWTLAAPFLFPDRDFS